LSSVTGVGGLVPGMPILPHGSGAYYNVYGQSIGFGIVSGEPIGYGEYMAYNGEIIGAAVNFIAQGFLGPYKIFACNYSTGVSFGFGTSPMSVSPSVSTGSVSYNTAIAFPANGTSAGIGVVTPNTGTYPSVPFASGEYIGIYIDGTPVAPPVLSYETLRFGLEGTLYLNI